MTDPLPEIREADAPPEIAMIYDDIRRTIGILLVNLVYRHFAATPGVLPWVWHVARQPIASGEIDSARLTARLEIPTLERLDLDATGDARLSRADLRSIDSVLEVYNRGNLVNLIALSVVRQLLEGATLPRRAAAGGRSNRSRAPAGAATSIPALPRIADLPPDVAALVADLAAQHGGADAKVIPRSLPASGVLAGRASPPSRQAPSQIPGRQFWSGDAADPQACFGGSNRARWRHLRRVPTASRCASANSTGA